jgi:2Fe-2S ferredoxin
MARIIIENLFGKIIDAEDTGKTLLQHFQDHALDWMHACGGKGRCTTCKVKITEGHDHLSAKTEAEHRYLKLRALEKDERLCCQAKINDSIRIRVPDECKLPHVQYSD